MLPSAQWHSELCDWQNACQLLSGKAVFNQCRRNGNYATRSQCLQNTPSYEHIDRPWLRTDQRSQGIYQSPSQKKKLPAIFIRYGPKKNNPYGKNKKKAISVILTSISLAWKYSRIWGSAGRYKSMDSGTNVLIKIMLTRIITGLKCFYSTILFSFTVFSSSTKKAG